MITSKKDNIDTIKVSAIIKKLGRIDGNYIETESTIIYQKQPFIISLLLGYRVDLKPDELNEITKVILIIWEYFKGNKKIGVNKITEQLFDRIQLRNAHMVKYFEGEQGKQAKSEVLQSDLNHLNSKGLLAGVLLCFNTNETFIKMDARERGIVIIGMKTLIECFEELEKTLNTTSN